MCARAGIFIDRDGVLNELVLDDGTRSHESPLRAADVRLRPGAATHVSELRKAGYPVVCVTNQPAAAKGLVTVATLEAIHQRVLDLLSQDGASVSGSWMCLHHPRGTVPTLATLCDCRKPAPGMLLAAADALDVDLSRSWMIGDTDADVLAGREAGCRTALVLNPDSAHKRLGTVTADLESEDLGPIVRFLVRELRWD